MEPPKASQSLELAEREEDADADAVSNPGSTRTSGTNKTSASRALARHLERSVMESSQEYITEQPPKKRGKKKSARSQLSTIQEAPNARVEEATLSLMQSVATQPDVGDDEAAVASQSHASGDESTGQLHDSERKRLVRELRRMKKTVLVSSGKAKWAPRINGAKWEMEKLPPNQWPNRALTSAEEQTLAKYKAKVKQAKQRLEEFDRNAQQTTAGGEAKKQETMSVEEPVTADVDMSDHVADGEISEKDVVMEEPGDEAYENSVKKRKNERKKLKKARRKSRLNPEADNEVEQDEPNEEPLLKPVQAVNGQKKRKRSQPQTMTSSPPQAMVADVRRPPLRSVAGKHKTELVKSWLNSQDEPMEDMGEAPEVGDLDMPGPSRKRKRVSKYQDDDDAEFQASGQGDDNIEAGDSEDDLPIFRPAAARAVEVGGSKASKKLGRSKKPTHFDDSQILPSRNTGGQFTKEEKSLADSIFSQVLQTEGIDEAALKHLICTWRSAGLFKEQIEAAFPERSKASTRRFCKRRYHMHERGAWTAEQDEDLRNAQANYPDMWTKHQDLVGRTAADCKDRWTMHLQYSKRTGAWSQEEEAQLMTAVEHAITTIKNDSETDPALASDRVALENAISWKGISKDLGNKRTNKQCREKWALLKSREQRELVNVPNRETSGDPAAPTVQGLKKRSTTERAVRKFEIGDFYDIFVEIHTSFNDTSEHYHDEENVVWSTVAVKNLASRFSLKHKGGALRRVALQHALREWKIDSSKVRRKLEKVDTLPAKAKVLAKLLEKSYAGRLHAMSRTFLPEMVGKSKEEILEIKAAKKRMNAERRKARKPKAKNQSKEYVDDDTDEEEMDDADIPRTPSIDDDDDEEEESDDDDRGDEEQSICQRRLDAQLNGREEDLVEEAEPEVNLPSLDGQPHDSDVKPFLEGSSEDASQDEQSADDVESNDEVIKKEESLSDASTGSAFYAPPDGVYPPPDPNDPVDAEMLRRFAAANAEADAKIAYLARRPRPVVHDGEHDDHDDDNEEDEEEVGGDVVEKNYLLSPGSVETPTLNRRSFVQRLQRS